MPVIEIVILGFTVELKDSLTRESASWLNSLRMNVKSTSSKSSISAWL